MPEPMLEPFVLARRLWQLGFIKAGNLQDALQAAQEFLDFIVRAYQKFHQLEVDGWVGPQTKASLEAPRFCGLPDVMPIQLTQSLCRWNKRQLYWAMAGQLAGITAEQRQQAYTLAWSYWSEVCNIGAVWSSTVNADVLMSAGAIDGGLGTLAWSELPCAGDDRPLRQLYDTSEQWVIAEGATPAGQIDLVRAACHELGHALGIPHITTGNLMAPIYSPIIRKPQAGDIIEAVQRYGPPAGPPLPPVPPEEIIVTFPQPVTKIKLVRMA